MVCTCESSLESVPQTAEHAAQICVSKSWEYVTTLDFEWSVVRGRRPFRWSIIVSAAVSAAPLSHAIWGSIPTLPLLLDLLPYTPGNPHFRDTLSR